MNVERVVCKSEHANGLAGSGCCSANFAELVQLYGARSRRSEYLRNPTIPNRFVRTKQASGYGRRHYPLERNGNDPD